MTILLYGYRPVGWELFHYFRFLPPEVCISNYFPSSPISVATSVECRIPSPLVKYYVHTLLKWWHHLLCNKLSRLNVEFTIVNLRFIPCSWNRYLVVGCVLSPLGLYIGRILTQTWALAYIFENSAPVWRSNLSASIVWYNSKVTRLLCDRKFWAYYIIKSVLMVVFNTIYCEITELLILLYIK
jgi:hypothetical protein